MWGIPRFFRLLAPSLIHDPSHSFQFLNITASSHTRRPPSIELQSNSRTHPVSTSVKMSGIPPGLPLLVPMVSTTSKV